MAHHLLVPCDCIRLFLEKIRHHPEFAQAPPPDKARVKKVGYCQCHANCLHLQCVCLCPQLLKTALPRAEELKQKLTDLQQAKINVLLKRKAEVLCWSAVIVRVADCEPLLTSAGCKGRSGTEAAGCPAGREQWPAGSFHCSRSSRAVARCTPCPRHSPRPTPPAASACSDNSESHVATAP